MDELASPFTPGDMTTEATQGGAARKPTTPARRYRVLIFGG